MENEDYDNIRVEVIVEKTVDAKGKKTPGYKFRSDVFYINIKKSPTEFLVWDSSDGGFLWVTMSQCNYVE